MVQIYIASGVARDGVPRVYPFADLLKHVPVNVPYKVLNETDPS
jgi:hypothetical protein